MVNDLGGVTSSPWILDIEYLTQWKINDFCQAMKYDSLLNRDFMGHLQIFNTAQVHVASIIIFNFISSSYWKGV